jgi:hypothetical protein
VIPNVVNNGQNSLDSTDSPVHKIRIISEAVTNCWVRRLFLVAGQRKDFFLIAILLSQFYMKLRDTDFNARSKKKGNLIILYFLSCELFT